jgi:hypothetical protein
LIRPRVNDASAGKGRTNIHWGKTHLVGEDSAEGGEVNVEVVVFLDVGVDAEVLVASSAGEGVEVGGGAGLGIEDADFEGFAVDDAAEGRPVRRDDDLGVAEELDLFAEGEVLNEDLLNAELGEESDELDFVEDASVCGAGAGDVVTTGGLGRFGNG